VKLGLEKAHRFSFPFPPPPAGLTRHPYEEEPHTPVVDISTLFGRKEEKQEKKSHTQKTARKRTGKGKGNWRRRR